MKLIQKNSLSELILAGLISFLISLPLVGFLHGSITAIDSSAGATDFKGRIIIGLMEAVASLLTIAAPFGENETENTQLRIITGITFILLTFIVYRVLLRRKNKRENKKTTANNVYNS